ncbi:MULTISPECIES: succinate dehydrogenase, hydrophobic membrane anchor protein [Idiomarina]|jgi:succinate dehydrogenase / fumarate reductase membrane anchor subunit|uniref:Succinate dehydrogenase hydrophobic membrane anchor subunit n=3 Tax=Idiomarina TaxID=135575 RepID=A0A432Y985_9GAMM|nr:MULTISPECIES: succinate dehydrogenase, hydrophobic membrane anchor protein [Idiomarina]MAD52705.1 succinate dehydrogenase, hydrophobic membrane anchor protein [Idiomarinaceae bacterium]MEC7642116.1 succinate dehydrogenase, hydrophobic membrane anchor protein [Pseudomonadota bacterium]EAQ32706.1 Succinate dehydrogenase, hydrophobic anchor subunit [Idiomarina baltica OS145]KXS35564.1 MAG: succinate dehydrogenase, hydrophobic anchor subunit [Idiomarina sp. T82-3]MAF75323.1 succinate dehydrogen|tara:strand:+ start:370 stop:717 length:348 start_codon:yes stop_codon:yes gene_type:complete
MVREAGTFGRSGPHDFILLRASAVVMLLYVLFMVGFFASTADVTYANWTGLFSNLWMKVFTLLALTGVLVHGWIGIWQVLTDYVKASGVRAFIQFVFSVGLIIVWLTGLFVLWGV